MTGRGSKPPEAGPPAPFDQDPWPGQAGYQPLGPPSGAEDEPAAEPASVPAAEAGAEQAPAEAPPAEESPLVSQHIEGELRIPAGYQMIEGIPLGGGRNVAIAVSRFNGEITSGLLASALAELERLGVQMDSVTIMPVPGAFELPLAAMALSKSRRYNCVIALGCVIRGETPHFEYIASEAASGVLLAGLETGVPVAFGVLTVDTVEQAEARLEKGAEAVRTALEMADAFGRLRTVAGA